MVLGGVLLLLSVQHGEQWTRRQVCMWGGLIGIVSGGMMMIYSLVLEGLIRFIWEVIPSFIGPYLSLVSRFNLF